MEIAHSQMLAGLFQFYSLSLQEPRTTKDTNRYKAELEGDEFLFSSAQERFMHYCVKMYIKLDETCHCRRHSKTPITDFTA